VCGRGGWEDGSDSDVMAAGRRGRAKTAGGMKAAEGGGGGGGGVVAKCSGGRWYDRGRKQVQTVGRAKFGSDHRVIYTQDDEIS
jgi:hypothetical protein